MRTLEYAGLDTARAGAACRRVTEAIARGDLRAAQVKKLANLAHGRFYRARLDDPDRLPFPLVRHGDGFRALRRGLPPAANAVTFSGKPNRSEDRWSRP